MTLLKYASMLGAIDCTLIAGASWFSTTNKSCFIGGTLWITSIAWTLKVFFNLLLREDKGICLDEIKKGKIVSTRNYVTFFNMGVSTLILLNEKIKIRNRNRNSHVGRKSPKQKQFSHISPILYAEILHLKLKKKQKSNGNNGGSPEKINLILEMYSCLNMNISLFIFKSIVLLRKENQQILQMQTEIPKTWVLYFTRLDPYVYIKLI